MIRRSAPTVWAVIPAAGVGRRMGGAVPKQYLQLFERPVIQWSLRAVLAPDAVRGAVVALGSGDRYWDDLHGELAKPVHTVSGGLERCYSVFNALEYLLDGKGHVDDWVLVHDAVRPCVTPDEIERLLREGLTSRSGALLGFPVRDTLKRRDEDGTVAETADRSGLWHAQTPQLFPLAALHEALEAALTGGLNVTDEAQAMERVGHRPRLVEGRATNLKITRPADLPLAEAILKASYPERALDDRDD